MQTLSLDRLGEQTKEEVIKWRRHFHQYPELSFHEENSSICV